MSKVSAAPACRIRLCGHRAGSCRLILRAGSHPLSLEARVGFVMRKHGIASPVAMRVSSSAAAASSAKARSTAVAITALAQKGLESRLRPQAPSRSGFQRPDPKPPCATGTLSASTPRSAKPLQAALSHPDGDD